MTKSVLDRMCITCQPPNEIGWCVGCLRQQGREDRYRAKAPALSECPPPEALFCGVGGDFRVANENDVSIWLLTASTPVRDKVLRQAYPEAEEECARLQKLRLLDRAERKSERKRRMAAEKIAFWDGPKCSSEICAGDGCLCMAKAEYRALWPESK
jgi:hypothetical protein